MTIIVVTSSGLAIVTPSPAAIAAFQMARAAFEATVVATA